MQQQHRGSTTTRGNGSFVRCTCRCVLISVITWWDRGSSAACRRALEAGTFSAAPPLALSMLQHRLEIRHLHNAKVCSRDVKQGQIDGSRCIFRHLACRLAFLVPLIKHINTAQSPPKMPVRRFQPGVKELFRTSILPTNTEYRLPSRAPIPQAKEKGETITGHYCGHTAEHQPVGTAPGKMPPKKLSVTPVPPAMPPQDHIASSGRSAPLIRRYCRYRRRRCRHRGPDMPPQQVQVIQACAACQAASGSYCRLWMQRFKLSPSPPPPPPPSHDRHASAAEDATPSSWAVRATAAATATATSLQGQTANDLRLRHRKLKGCTACGAAALCTWH